MQLQRALHNPSRGIRVLSSETIGQKKKNIYILFNHKFSSCTSYAMHIFKHYVITLEKSCVVSSSSVYFGVHSPWDSQNLIFSCCDLKSSDIVVWLFFVKGVLLSLPVRFVITGSVLPPTSRRVTFPMWLRNAIFVLFRKWQIVLLDKTLTPQLGLCRTLWSCIETAIWTFNLLVPLKSTIWRKILEYFSQKPWVSKLSRHFYSGSELIL